MSALKEFEAAAERHRQASKEFDLAESALAGARAKLNRAGSETNAAWQKYMKEREAAALMAKEQTSG